MLEREPEPGSGGRAEPGVIVTSAPPALLLVGKGKAPSGSASAIRPGSSVLGEPDVLSPLHF